MKVICLICAVAVIIAFNSTAFADSMMCQRGVVRSGDSASQVLDKCGKPVHKTRDDTADGKSAETWTYKIRGSYRDFYFERGVLKVIRDKTLT